MADWVMVINSNIVPMLQLISLECIGSLHADVHTWKAHRHTAAWDGNDDEYILHHCNVS